MNSGFAAILIGGLSGAALGCGGPGGGGKPISVPDRPLQDPALVLLDRPPPVDAGAAPVIAGGDERPSPRLAAVAVSWPTDRSKAQLHFISGGAAWSTALAVSADGSTPIGVAQAAGGQQEAVRWRDGTMTPLGMLDLPGRDSSMAWAVSRNGDVVVGASTATETSAVPVIWRGDAPLATLPLPSGTDSAEARAVSRDGSIITGCTTETCNQILRWTAGTALPVDVPQPFSLAAHAMSEDGAVLAGTIGSEPEEGLRIAITGSGAVERRGAGSHVEGISDDGKVMVGNIGPRAVLWRGKTVTELGMVPGYDTCHARAVSADGGRVIGNCVRAPRFIPAADDRDGPPPDDPQSSVAFIWDKKAGIRPVAAAIEKAGGGTLAAGIWLDEAFDICGYGLTLVGNGRGPNGARSEAWMAIVPR